MRNLRGKFVRGYCNAILMDAAARGQRYNAINAAGNGPDLAVDQQNVQRRLVRNAVKSAYLLPAKNGRKPSIADIKNSQGSKQQRVFARNGFRLGQYRV
jgi:hypothetical protein